jgi:uncharacterized protein YgbK (DUF1537 family)
VLATPAAVAPSLGPHAIAERFAHLAARLIQQRRISGVVVTGGDGARALVDALKADRITLLDEVVPGVPFGVVVGGAADGLSLVTKSGGFGDEETLLAAVEAVRRPGPFGPASPVRRAGPSGPAEQRRGA